MQNCGVILERDLESRLKTLVAGVPAKCTSLTLGLLIGHRSENADYIIHLARCPLPDVALESETTPQQSTPDKKSGQKSPSSSAQSSILMDEEWILHHVEQAVRMLPGSLSILGLFAIGEKRQILENQAFLSKTLRSIRRLCTKIDGAAFSIDTTSSVIFSNRMLLLNYDVASKKPNVNLVDCVDTRVQSSSVTFNYQKIHWTNVTYRAQLNFPAFVAKANGKKSFQDQFLAASSSFFRQLNNAEATFNGRFRDVYETLTESSKKSSSNEQQFDVCLYVDDDDVDDADILTKQCAVKMFVKGSVVGRISLPQKSTVGEALKCVKIDLLRSVYARIELHSEGMLVVEGEELEPIALHQLPRRVFAPLTSDLMICDYLFEGDGGEDSVQSLKEVLDVDVALDRIEDGFETAVDEENLSNLNLSFSLFTGAGSTSTVSSTNNPDADVNDDFADRINKIETEKQARLSVWPLYLTLISFVVGLISYLIYMWVSSNEH